MKSIPTMTICIALSCVSFLNVIWYILKKICLLFLPIKPLCRSSLIFSYTVGCVNQFSSWGWIRIKQLGKLPYLDKRWFSQPWVFAVDHSKKNYMDANSILCSHK